MASPGGAEWVPGDLAVSRSAQDLDSVLARVAAVGSSGVNTRSPRYLGYLPSGGLYASAVGDFLGSVLNPYSALESISPGAVALERAVVEWLRQVVGLPDTATGVLTSGGSLATLTAVVAARELTGMPLRDLARYPVYVGEHRHHSVDRALRFAGLSDCPVRVVASDVAYRMDVGLLRLLVRADRAAGLVPWLVVPTAGTTSSGTIDPVADVVDVARAHDMWVHVDAAYGGLFGLADAARPRLAGLGDADSVVVDPHKSLFLPYGTGALLVRDPATLTSVFAHSASYLPDDTGSASPADLGMELTRPFRALGLWLPLQLAGADTFSAALTEKLDLARRLHGFLSRHPRFEAGPEPDLTVVTFRAVTRSGDAEVVNQRLADRLQRSTEVFLSPTRLDGKVTLRAAIGSVRTHRDDVDAACEVIARLADELAAG
jgi:glutamate/tyrosine decarboxylase-like PLP-dependent enzyme